jgi:hypothetical protein
MKNNTIKIVSIVMVMFFCFSTGAMGKITRDINHDGIVNVSDLQSLLGIYVNKSADVESIDFNKDQKFDLKDALNLHRYFFEPSNQNTTPLNRTRSLKSDRFESPYLEVTNNSGNMNETISVEILLQGNYDPALTEASGAAFTIRYHHDLILDEIDSDYFGTFEEQFIDTTYVGAYTTTSDDGTVYDQPIVYNVDKQGGNVKIAAARCCVTDNAIWPGNVLFNIKFRLRDGAEPGKYLIKIAPTILNYPAAGYYEDTAIDMFVGSDPYKQPTDPNAYPVLIDSLYDIHGNSVHAIHGSVTFINNTSDHISTNDIDNDGIMDDWEFENFKNLVMANSCSDNDNDGFSESLEQLNQTVPTKVDEIYTNQYVERIFEIKDIKDTDDDTILDDWEYQHFGNLRTANANTDYDHDNGSDRLEWLSQTNPKEYDFIYTSGQSMGINFRPIAEEQVVTVTSESMNITLSGDDDDGYYLRYIITSLPEFGTLYGKVPFLIYKSNPGINKNTYFTFQVFDGFELSQPKKVYLNNKYNCSEKVLSLKDVLLSLQVLAGFNPDNIPCCIDTNNNEKIELIDILYGMKDISDTHTYLNE